MHFHHSPGIWQDHPELVAGVICAVGITPHPVVRSRCEPFNAVVASRLAGAAEGEFPEIQAWRRAFSKMGLKPTQYRCAAESLLRRFRKEGALPSIHPLIDLCNAVSMAFAIPVAVFDIAGITGGLEVRHAAGTEDYLSFSGETEQPDRGEVIFADEAGRAHARRWTNRQSGSSAIRSDTSAVLLVAEALHDSAGADIQKLTAVLAGEIKAIWQVEPRSMILGQSRRRFDA